jgi:hypothetical protein
MKKLLLIFSFLLIAFLGYSQTPKTTKGYVKKNGTYVAPAYKTKPNKTKADNYSTKGNTNPFTGKKGTVNPDANRRKAPKK